MYIQERKVKYLWRFTKHLSRGVRRNLKTWMLSSLLSFSDFSYSIILLISNKQQTQTCWWYHSNGRKRRGTKQPLDEGERRQGKSSLKTQHLDNIKIMASIPITSWQIEGGNVEAVTNFLFLGSKITVDGDCSHEIRCLLLGRKALAT